MDRVSVHILISPIIWPCQAVKNQIMKIFTTQEIREIDQYTIDNDGVSSVELIERVAEGIACEITSRWTPRKPTAIFAGPGNNGADALAVARLLAEQGFRPEVFLFNIGGNKLSLDCAKMRNLLRETPGVDLIEVVSNFSLPDLTSSHLVIDGLFGSGLHRPLSGGFVSLVQYINESMATVVAIDIPSGLYGEWNPEAINRNIIHANLTLAVQAPKLSFFISDYADIIGEWKVLDIELSPEKIRSISPQYHLVEKADVRRMLRRRPDICSKADFGSTIIYAGSYGMMGAAVLATRGSLRSGVGKTTIYSPRCGFNILQSTVPEALFSEDRDDLVISEIAPSHRFNSIAIGPGIGTRDATVKALEDFLAGTTAPVILDADALNCIAARPAMLSTIPILSILTPHAGEFDRLFGTQVSAEARLRKAIEVARYYNIFIILKGHYTALVRPDGKVYFNSSGCAAMATPGCGDVLTGILASMSAQGYSPEYAAIISVFVHGVAGELAAERHGQYGVTAGDIADNVGRAINEIMTKSK